MPNGRRRSQRSRAANQRRNRDRDRRSAAAAAAEVRQASDTVAGLLHHTVVQGTADDVSACPPLSAMDGNPSEVVEALRRIQDWEIKCSVVDCSAVLAALASKGLPSAIVDCLRELALSRREKITAPACEIVAMMLSNLRKGNIAVPLITEDLVEPLVESLRTADWHGITASDVCAWIELLNVHHTPRRVIDAVTSCFTAHLKRVDPDASSSSSSSDEDEFVDVQGEPGQPDPEPQAIECMTCCLPTAPCMLITCDQDTACEYRQCIECVVKGGGGACTTPGCMTMHHTCPACRAICSGIKLTDDRLTKAHVLSVLDAGRERNQKAIDRHMEEMDQTMREMNRRIGELCSESFGVVRAE
jgi:hypothetical protein